MVFESDECFSSWKTFNAVVKTAFRVADRQNAKSNHPPNIKKQLPKMISSRLSRNSCSLQEFDKTIPECQLALEKSGYREKLTYVKEEPKQTDQFNSTSKNQSRNRTRKIIWFNPPFNDEVTTNSVFFKVWLEEPLSNFEKPLIFFLLFLSILSFVYTIVVAIAVPAQKILGGQ